MGIYFSNDEYTGVQYNGFQQYRILIRNQVYHVARFLATLFVLGTINASGVVQRMYGVLQDRNTITRINSVRFDILRNGVSRLFHVGFAVLTSLPSNRVEIEDARLPEGTTALATDTVQVAVNFTDETGTHDITDSSGAFSVVDTPGQLALDVVRRGRNYNFTFSVSDPDGIRAITAASVTASDGTTSNIMRDFSRSDANTFIGTDSRRNVRWASGTMSVTYTDNRSGASHTHTQDWSTNG